MEINTSSATISFARKLEEDSTKFYEDLSQRYPKNEDVFLTFAKENRKYIVQIERAYYGVITDALEGCFAFNINTVGVLLSKLRSLSRCRQRNLVSFQYSYRSKKKNRCLRYQKE